MQPGHGRSVFGAAGCGVPGQGDAASGCCVESPPLKRAGEALGGRWGGGEVGSGVEQHQRCQMFGCGTRSQKCVIPCFLDRRDFPSKREKKKPWSR